MFKHFSKMFSKKNAKRSKKCYGFGKAATLLCKTCRKCSNIFLKTVQKNAKRGKCYGFGKVVTLLCKTCWKFPNTCRFFLQTKRKTWQKCYGFGKAATLLCKTCWKFSNILHKFPEMLAHDRIFQTSAFDSTFHMCRSISDP